MNSCVRVPVTERVAAMDRIIRLAGIAGAVLLALLATLTFLDVVGRYLLSRTLPGAYELGQQLQTVIIFWGMAIATYHRAHIGVDLLWERFGPAGRARLDRFGDAVCAGAFAAMLVCGALQLPKMIRSSEVIPDLGLPLWLFTGIALAGIAAAFLGACQASSRAIDTSVDGGDGQVQP
jgi:TRAP-type C4-dicarboxylate transport system permease small subunit